MEAVVLLIGIPAVVSPPAPVLGSTDGICSPIGYVALIVVSSLTTFDSKLCESSLLPSRGLPRSAKKYAIMLPC